MNCEVDTMAAVPAVLMQRSPATELSVPVPPAGAQPHGERVKTEEVTGERDLLSAPPPTLCHAPLVSLAKLASGG